VPVVSVFNRVKNKELTGASGQESVVLAAEVEKLGHCLHRGMNFPEYTDFINGGRAVKNWYLVMKTRRFRINNFRVTRVLGEFVRFYRVLKIFFVEQAVYFIFLVQF